MVVQFHQVAYFYVLSPSFEQVVDGLDLIPQCLDAVKGIKNSISGKPCTMIFQGPSGGSNIEAIESILRKPFHTLSINEPRNSQGIRSICGHPDI